MRRIPSTAGILVLAAGRITGGTYAHSYERCFCTSATSLNWVQDGWGHLVVCTACFEMDDGDTVVCW